MDYARRNELELPVDRPAAAVSTQQYTNKNNNNLLCENLKQLEGVVGYDNVSPWQTNLTDSGLWQNYRIPSNYLPHYLAKSKHSAIQLHIHISENNKLHIKQHLFHEFLFACLFFFLKLTSLQDYCDILFVALFMPFNYAQDWIMHN